MEENVNPEDLSLDDQVAILMADLPKPVQDFLRSPERDAVSMELSTKYALHADQAGVFEQAYIYMLLGVYTPDEFVQELHDAHIPEETVRGLTTDVNERVFKRLQNAERTPAPVVAAPIPPPIPLQPKPAPPAPMPFSPPPAPKPAPAAIPIYVPPAAPAPMPPVSAPAPFVPPPVSMPVPPPAPQPVFTTPPPAPAPMPAPPAHPMEHPAIRTMASDMQFMKEEVEHPHAPTPPSAWQPPSPARTFQTSSVPTTAPPAPVVPTPAPAPMVQPPTPLAPRPFSMPTPPPNLPGQPAGTHPEAEAPIVKEYGVDPYRELPT